MCAGNKIGAPGADSLAKMLEKNKTLTKLDLSGKCGRGARSEEGEGKHAGWEIHTKKEIFGRRGERLIPSHARSSQTQSISTISESSKRHPSEALSDFCIVSFALAR